PSGMGSNAPPWICQVLRPSNNASVWLIASKKCAPMSSCQNGPVHPPCVKPPSVSSSAPPGACMTLSNDTNSATTIFRTVPSVQNRFTFHPMYHQYRDQCATWAHRGHIFWLPSLIGGGARSVRLGARVERAERQRPGGRGWGRGPNRAYSNT